MSSSNELLGQSDIRFFMSTSRLASPHRHVQLAAAYDLTHLLDSWAEVDSPIAERRIQEIITVMLEFIGAPAEDGVWRESLPNARSVALYEILTRLQGPADGLMEEPVGSQEFGVNETVYIVNVGTGEPHSPVKFVNIDLSDRNLEAVWVKDVCVPRMSFKRSVLKFARMLHSTIDESNLAGTNLESFMLSGSAKFCDMTNANMTGVILEGDFTGTLFTGSDLSMASIQNSNLQDCDFGGATIDAANFTGSIAEPDTFLHAKANQWTVFPDGKSLQNTSPAEIQAAWPGVCLSD